MTKRLQNSEKLLALWAFGEACFWFIAPDFLLIPFAIERPERWRRSASVAWTASFVGGTFYFVFCSQFGELANSIITHTPFVTLRMMTTISALYEQYGYWGVLWQSWSFMSFKIWTFLAVEHGFSWWIYLPTVMLSRVFRLFVVSWIASKLSPYLRQGWMRYRAIWWVAYTCGFLLMLIVMER